MSKKVLILSGSPRKGGNSDLLCDEFKKGAEQSGNTVEKISIADKHIEYCMGCFCCAENNGVCVIQDDMGAILEKIQDADVLVLSSPVYFFSVSAQMKTLIDRTVARWTQIKNKEFYYIATAAENGEHVMDCTLECFRGLAVSFEGSVEKGAVCGMGVSEPGDIKNHPAMKEAYEMGKQI